MQVLLNWVSQIAPIECGNPDESLASALMVLLSYHRIVFGCNLEEHIDDELAC